MRKVLAQRTLSVQGVHLAPINPGVSCAPHCHYLAAVAIEEAADTKRRRWR